jgi:predicted NAD-dependent protein-ADP-ribosyltransferase YbiA (DUF1768 family)
MSRYPIRMDILTILENKRDYYQQYFEFDNNIYPATENLYQALKNKFIAGRYDFRFMNPFESKERGRMISGYNIKSNWPTDRLIAMELVIDLKFNQHPNLAEKLIKVPDELLVEWNDWGDIFWGKCIKTNRGNNHLGEILKRKKYELLKERNE